MWCIFNVGIDRKFVNLGVIIVFLLIYLGYRNIGVVS